MANQFNYETILCNSMIAGKTVEEIRRQFRGSKTKNTQVAMEEIVAKYSAIDHPNAVLVVNMAQAVMANPQEATVEKNWLDMIPAQGQVKVAQATRQAPQFMVKQAAQVIAQVPVAAKPQVVKGKKGPVSLDDDDTVEAPAKAAKAKYEHVDHPVVVPQWMVDGVGVYRITCEKGENGEADNLRLEALSQGFWKAVMTTKMYYVAAAKINLLNKAMSKFGDKTKTEFDVTINGKKVGFVYLGSSKNPHITKADGKIYISKAQADKYYGPLMKQFVEVHELCSNSVAELLG